MRVNNTDNLNLELCKVVDNYTNSKLYGIEYCPTDWDLHSARLNMSVDFEFDIYEDINCAPFNTLTCDCNTCYEESLLTNNEFSEITIGINRVSNINDSIGTSVQIINDGSTVEGNDPETNQDFRYIDVINLYTSTNVRVPLVKVVYHTLGSVKTYEWLNTNIAAADRTLIENAITFNTLAKGLIYNKRDIDSVLKGYSFLDNEDYTTPFSTSTGTNYLEAIEPTLTLDNNSKDQQGMRWVIEASGTVLNTTNTIVSNTNDVLVRLFIKRLKVLNVGAITNTYSSPYALDEARISHGFRDAYPLVSIPTGTPHFVTGSEWYHNKGTSAVVIDGTNVAFTGPNQFVIQGGLTTPDVLKADSYLDANSSQVYQFQTYLVELPMFQIDTAPTYGNALSVLETDGYNTFQNNELYFITLVRENLTTPLTYTNLSINVLNSSLTTIYTSLTASITAGDWYRSFVTLPTINKGESYIVNVQCTSSQGTTLRSETKIVIAETY